MEKKEMANFREKGWREAQKGTWAIGEGGERGSVDQEGSPKKGPQSRGGSRKRKQRVARAAGSEKKGPEKSAGNNDPNDTG